MSKVIRVCFGFAFLRSVIGWQNSRNFLTKTNRGLLARVSRAWRQLHVFASSFDWFIALFISVVIGQSNYFGFGFTTLK